MFHLVPLDTLLTFATAGILLNLTPGSDVMFATASGMVGGPRAGMAAGAGVGLGGFWHVGLAALGVAGPAQATTGTARLARAFWRGFLTNALNPKVALFVLAFLPQFTDPARGPVWQQILILGAVFTATGMVITSGYGALAGVAGQTLAARMGVMNKLAAGVFALLALRMMQE
jgi:threonine/homoserine/homoserine lactone efflux protein